MIASSGIPFNITSGQDVFGDAQFNTRPSFATCGGAAQTNVVQTVYGCFNTLPGAGPPIPINFATAPGRFTFNLRVSKSFGFGQKKEAVASGASGGGGGRGAGGGGGGPRMGGGPGGPGGGMGGMFGGAPSNYRYNVTFSVNERNIFNNVNDGPFIGNLSSPLFGQANSLAGQPYSSSTANRRIDLQLQFTF